MGLMLLGESDLPTGLSMLGSPKRTLTCRGRLLVLFGKSLANAEFSSAGFFNATFATALSSVSTRIPDRVPTFVKRRPGFTAPLEGIVIDLVERGSGTSSDSWNSSI